LSRTVEYSSIHVPEALAQFAMPVSEVKVHEKRKEFFACPLRADIKARE
jgi:hypothetical protein